MGNAQACLPVHLVKIWKNYLTGVNEDKLELHLYYCAGIYDASGIGVLPINNKTKSRLKKIVQYISENGFDDFNIKNF
ncbi:hypothetical protein Asfd1_110 [Aeromonas phage Asfd_1]|nr:hypothetical protein Asfd1_110 [Aeromonas phage Asfd_1]